MTKVTLVYPYFRPFNDDSVFRFPPLGLGYIASSLRKHGVSVTLVDCTFLTKKEALKKIQLSNPEIIGIYSMFSMKQQSIALAKLRKNCEILIAGGPLPTLTPKDFLREFDVVVIGEGEETIVELVDAIEKNLDLSTIKGIVYREKGGGDVGITPSRAVIRDLDGVSFPSRDLFDNQSYKNYYSKKFGYTITSMITSRGCPFNCDFCSRSVFGNEFRTRSAVNIVDEIETVLALGYDRIWFADDCFTLNRKRLIEICDEIINRRLRVGWECLSRVDTIDRDVANKMREAGCVRVFFGIESGNNSVLAVMNKQTTVERARKAVFIAKKAGIQVGAFFILGYPSESDKTVLDTVRFASSLPLDYLSFTLPYPIPGTPLYERVKGEIALGDWNEPKNLRFIRHELLFRGGFSEGKLKFAIGKAMVQFYLRKYLGNRGYRLVGIPFERLTNLTFELIR
ncbi:radical SAM protein [Candidatus Bathyarchaeota archaeon]|nr:radical SAM protein [Candidatus Bathyarchaeota archaeon]